MIFSAIKILKYGIYWALVLGVLVFLPAIIFCKDSNLKEVSPSRAVSGVSLEKKSNESLYTTRQVITKILATSTIFSFCLSTMSQICIPYRESMLSSNTTHNGAVISFHIPVTINPAAVYHAGRNPFLVAFALIDSAFLGGWASLYGVQETVQRPLEKYEVSLCVAASITGSLLSCVLMHYLGENFGIVNTNYSKGPDERS